VPCGTLKLMKKEFSDLNQGGMMVNEYLNQFIQLSRYATNDLSTNEKKHDTLLKGLNDKIQVQLLNTDYPNFQHLVDKTIIIENKIKEMEKDGKHKMVFRASIPEATLGLASCSPVSLSEPHF
jgi:Zn-dependent M32 family carboxypeptidase